MNRKSMIVLFVGCLFLAASLLPETILPGLKPGDFPDFLKGVFAGVALGLLIVAVILQKKVAR